MKIMLLSCVVPRYMNDLLQLDLFKSLGVDTIILLEMDRPGTL